MYVLSEEIESQIYEDKILRQLCEDREHVLGRPLRTLRHVMIRVVFEHDTAKQERYDPYDMTREVSACIIANTDEHVPLI